MRRQVAIAITIVALAACTRTETLPSTAPPPVSTSRPSPTVVTTQGLTTVTTTFANAVVGSPWPGYRALAEALDEAESRWAEVGSDSYTVQVHWECDCPWAGTWDVTVAEGGIAKLQSVTSSDLISLHHPLKIPLLFLFIRGAIEVKATFVQAVFDPELGYPVRFLMDRTTAEDDDYLLAVSEVELHRPEVTFPWPGYQWFGPDGDPVPFDGDIISVVQGFSHCEWQAAAFLTVGWPLGTPPETIHDRRQYIRDPYNIIGTEFFTSRYDGDATIPDDATFTGYVAETGMELWLAPSDQDEVAYLVFDDHVERWPRPVVYIGCN